MKIVITAINARYTHSNLANLYIQNYLKKNDKKSVRLEFSINQQIDEILERIYLEKPEIVTFSIYIWNTDIHKKILSVIKKLLPKVKIIIGGPEVTYNIKFWEEKFPQIDYLCKGYAQNCFSKLLDTNMSFPRKIIEAEFPVPKLIFPYNDSNIKSFTNKYIYYESSNGCPFQCSYCLSSRDDKKQTQKNIEEVKSEIDFFIKHEVKIVKFVDRTFNASQKFSQVIWSYLSEKNTNTKFHFEIYPSFLNEDAFKILQQVKTDLFQFEIGIQTIHKRTLTEIKRFGDWNKIKPKIERLSKMNIHIHLDQIVGLPFEDYQKIKESFNEIYSLKSDHYQLGFLKVLPGTEMAEKAREYNLIFNSNPPYQIFSNKWLNFSEILLLQKIAKLVEGIYNSHKFERTIKTLENFFENPFDFWEELAIFYKKNDFSFHSKWEVTAKNLQKFADEKLIKQTSESLRWDWHLIANAHYYPEFINDENLIKIKRQNYLWIKEIFATKDFAKYKIKPKDLKKAIFYQNEKEEFLTFSLKKNNKRLIFKIDTKKNQIKELQNIL